MALERLVQDHLRKFYVLLRPAAIDDRRAQSFGHMLGVVSCFGIGADVDLNRRAENHWSIWCRRQHRLSFKRTPAPSVVLNDTYQPREADSTVAPPKPNLPQRFLSSG